MNEVKAPGETNFASSQNLSETSRRWKRGMEYYLAATCTDETGDTQKVAIFMCMIRKDGEEIKDTFEFETGLGGAELITTEILFAKKNVVVKRHRFLTRDQAAGESVDQYVKNLKIKKLWQPRASGKS